MVNTFWKVKSRVWYQKNDDKKLGKKKMLEEKGYNVEHASEKELEDMEKDAIINKRTKRKWY